MMKISSRNIFDLLKRFFKQINAPYRLTLSNEETMSESLTMRLTKKSVYIFLSTFLVLLFLLFTALFLLTPVRYYIPGANTNISRTKLIQLQKLSDSLMKINTKREQYIYNLIRIANGGISTNFDTTLLTDKQIEIAKQQNLNQIDHASRYDYLKKLKQDTTETESENGDQKDTLQKNKKFKEKN